jgi:predicted  nucleic acid-binding Zn-ribbon protein
MSLTKRDQENIAKLYESTGYTGETNDYYSGDEPTLEQLHAELRSVRDEAVRLNRQYEDLMDQFRHNEAYKNELLTQIKALDPNFYEG